MSEDSPPAAVRSFSGRTAWARNLQTPLRLFLRTETGSAAVLLGMTVVALAWVNIDASSYAAVWGARLSVRLSGAGVSLDLREWVNSGLMTFFFFVFGLEARREFDMGELRERARLALPVAAGLGGLLVPVAIYLAINAGRPTVHGWGAAMLTDTAFALGMLALTGPRFPDRVRAFLLSVAVVDDLASLVVIGAAYTTALTAAPLAVAAGIFIVILALRQARIRYGIVYALLGIAAWVAVLKSGIDPVVVGLVMGLLTFAYPAARTDLERASDLFRSFREQPTPDLAQSARAGLASALSPNERLQQLYHPWTSYVIVPLFALANAGISISGAFLARAYTSPVTLGHPHRLRRRETPRHHRWIVAAHPPEPRPAAAAGRLGRRRGRRHDRRHRLRGVHPDRDPGLHRNRPAGGQAWCPVHGGRRARGHLAHLPRYHAAARPAADPRAARHLRGHH